MVRFIYIGEQIDEGAKDFAFYDTISDEFIEFYGTSVFSCLEDFLEVCNEPRFLDKIDLNKVDKCL